MMSSLNNQNLHSEQIFELRSQAIFTEMRTEQFKRTDRMFALLMLLQWLAAIVCALWISPTTWAGDTSGVHFHVWMAVILGGLLTSLPVYLAFNYPGKTATRYVIAVAQVLFSGLLIHLSGGRIETHFHVFGSLAFLAIYRDWKLLIPATLIIAIDHIGRGLFYPQSIYGVMDASLWRSVEHAAWVIFEDFFLILSCRQSVKETWEIASRTAQLENTNVRIEKQIAERTIDLKNALEAAKASDHAKSEFLANMSHEIRTPLNGILGFTDLLIRDESYNQEERLNFLGDIQSSGKHLLTLINDILDLSKIESGQMEVERIKTSPHEVISQVMSVMRVQAQEKGLNLEYRWQSLVPQQIETDPTRLRQMLINLVGNAIKFTSKGSVHIEARLNESGAQPMIEFSIRDTGIGIAADKLDQIFSPFVQADNSVTRCFGGTGLGLTISRRISTALGGELTVESIVGEGTTFIASIATGSLTETELLDAPKSDAFAGSSTLSVDQNQTLPPANLLIVDDGVINLKLMVALLAETGVNIKTAENGQIGMELALKEKFDLILMDMQMPVMDGYTATTQLREAGYTAPIIALTAHAMKGDQEKCLSVGCTGYLSKPIQTDELMSSIYEALTNSKLQIKPASQEQHIPEKSDSKISTTLPIDNPVFLEIVQEFGEYLDMHMGKIYSAVESQDTSEILQLAHSLVGVAGSAGFGDLSVAARELETHSREENIDQYHSAWEILHDLQNRIDIPAK